MYASLQHESNRQSNYLGYYASFALVCCSLIAAQPPIIQPANTANTEMNIVTIENNEGFIPIVCCSLIAAQPPIIQPANTAYIEMNIVTIKNNEGFIPNGALSSQVANEAKDSFNSSIILQLYAWPIQTHSSDSYADIYQGHPSGSYWLSQRSPMDLS